MLPLELVSPTMRTIAHLTPHAWAAEGFAILVRRGGGLVDVLPQVGVLLSIAFAVLVVAAWRLRRTLSTRLPPRGPKRTPATSGPAMPAGGVRALSMSSGPLTGYVKYLTLSVKYEE